jgi:aminoglycoside 3-N-acetyltransferase
VKPEVGDGAIRVMRSDVTAAVLGVGVVSGDTVMFHSSLSSMGTVVGGADTVIDGFLDAVGPGGTVAVPTLWLHETDPPIRPEDWDIETSPSYVGRVTEVFRRRPDSVRSDNLSHSVSAIGARAEELTRDHGKGGLRPCVFGDTAFAKESPWERLYLWNAAYCFIGVDFTVNTMGHYSECNVVERALSRAPLQKRTVLTARLRRRGKPGVWPRHSFQAMGERLAEMGLVRLGGIGSATVRCCRARDMVDNTLAVLDAEPEKWFDEEFLAWLAEAGKGDG